MNGENIMDKITVDIEKLDTIMKVLHDTNTKEVSFEFLVGSCFPKILTNIKEEMKRQHAMGYAEGLKESQK